MRPSVVVVENLLKFNHYNTCQIQLDVAYVPNYKFPRILMQCKLDSKLSVVYNYTRSILGSTEFELRTTHPSRLISEDLNATVESLNIEGSSIMVKYIHE